MVLQSTVFHLLTVSITSPASPTTTVALSLSSVDVVAVSRQRQRQYYHPPDVRDSIASRLPARSQATIHCRPRTAIAQRLLPRIANRATFNLNRTYPNPKRNTGLRI
jgi:hypothetical protein